MKLTFKKMTMHSFMSFQDETFDFSEKTGMVLIRGRNNDVPNETNGSGKSTIGYGLLFSLFGQLQSRIKNENIVCRSADDRDMKLTLEFSVDDMEYSIERGLLRGKNSYLKLFRAENGGFTDITKSTIQETQAYLETEVLKCDIDVFLRTMLLTADQSYNFYMMKKQDKKEFVEKLFDIGVFGEMHDKMHKDALRLEKSAIAGQNQLMVISRNMSDWETRSATFEKQKNDRHSILTESLKQAGAERESLKKSRVDVNEDALGKLENAIEKLENAISQKNDEMRSVNANVRKLAAAKSRLETLAQQRKASIGTHAEILEKLCDDCRPVFKNYYSIDQMQKELDDSSGKILKINAREKEENAKITGASAKIEEYNGKIQLIRQKIKSLTSEQTRVQTALAQAELKLQCAERDLLANDSQANPYSEMLETARKQFEKTGADTDKIVLESKYLNFAENVVSQDTLRKFIIKDLIGILNNKIKKYLVNLGAKYYVEFNEDMDYEFIPTVGTCEFGNFSGGEKMRLMIATSFAFRDFMSIRNGLNSNVLILDEYFDSAISSACIESLMKILREYSEDMKQTVFVITHRPEVQPESFDGVIQVEKTHDISRIKYIS